MCTTDSGSFHPICKAFYQLCLVIVAEADWRVQVDGRTSILCVCNQLLSGKDPLIFGHLASVVDAEGRPKAVNCQVVAAYPLDSYFVLGDNRHTSLEEANIPREC